MRCVLSHRNTDERFHPDNGVSASRCVLKHSQTVLLKYVCVVAQDLVCGQTAEQALTCFKVKRDETSSFGLTHNKETK